MAAGADIWPKDALFEAISQPALLLSQAGKVLKANASFCSLSLCNASHNAAGFNISFAIPKQEAQDLSSAASSEHEIYAVLLGKDMDAPLEVRARIVPHLMLSVGEAAPEKVYVALLRLAEEASDISTIYGALRSALDIIPEGFVIYDQQDRLLLCNASYKRLYNKSAPSMVPGTPFEEILRYGLAHGQYLEAGETQQEHEAWLQKRLAMHRKAGEPVIQRLADDKWLYIEEKITPENFVVGVRSDISRLKLSERKLEQLNHLLLSRNRALDQFAGIVAHDLQAPLRQMSLLIDIAFEALQAQDVDEAADKLARAQSRAQKMRELIASLLQYSRIAFASVNAQECSFGDLVRLAAEGLEAKAQTLDAALEVSGADVCFECDREVFALMLQNLMSNAITYQSGLHKPVVKLIAQQTEHEVHLAIEDNGIGIDVKYAERIFKMFERLHRDDSAYTGTGLGLALARQIVQGHHGRLWLDTGYVEGARFLISMPKHQPTS
jgi:signal transduction histidine kinase